jgi:hypothetical protein
MPALERATALAEGDHLIAMQPVPLGIDEWALAGPDDTASRKVGHAVAWLGHDGLIIPSARANGLNLVVFVNNQDVHTELEAVDSEVIADPRA